MSNKTDDVRDVSLSLVRVGGLFVILLFFLAFCDGPAGKDMHDIILEKMEQRL